MARSVDEFDRPAAHCPPEALVRTLRHEVGDLLQTVYATVAILQKRLAAGATLERQILADLRNRAEASRRLLDDVTDLVSPLRLSIEEVELTQLAAVLIAAVAPRFPKLEIRAESSERVWLPADEKRLSQAGEALLTQACEGALRRVCVRTRPNPAGEGVEWTFTDDRPSVGTEEQGDSFDPFDLTHPGNSGIRLTLARRLVQLHGGTITAAPMPEAGFCVRICLPAKTPASNREPSAKAPNE
jgi:signal transduction histidine kinase